LHTKEYSLDGFGRIVYPECQMKAENIPSQAYKG
jgi:hypothetical protein